MPGGPQGGSRPAPYLTVVVLRMGSRVGPIHVDLMVSASPARVLLAGGSAPRSIVVEALPAASVTSCGAQRGGDGAAGAG
jgi:hypothetical protein